MNNKLSQTFLLLLSAFAVLTVLVQFGVFTRFDWVMTQSLQRFIPRTFDLSLSVFSLLGTAEFASMIFLVLLVFSKGLNKLLMLSLYILTAVIELIGKSLISQNAPPISLLRTYQFFKVPSGEISGQFFSYPSGHSARTAFVSAFFLYVIWDNKKLSREMKYFLSAVVAVFDFLMFGSRVYLGEHWLTDVIGGGVLGFLLFLSGFYLSRRFVR